MPEEFPSISGYKIESKIGEGGMAQVYLAMQEGFDRHVALKVLSSDLISDDEYKIRFSREARISAKMSHHSIVPVYDYGSCGDFHYIAMEYLPGGDLKQKMLNGITLEQALEITITIAKGLDYAGKKNLVHRDIKPENILFREDNSPVISDFGIARQTNSQNNLTIVGSIIGTPKYMSPEQAQGKDLDQRSDLYALGTMFYELLTGKPPFQGDSAISVGIKHITEVPPALPPELAVFRPFVDQILKKDPKERFQTGQELAEALQAYKTRLINSTNDTVTMKPLKAAFSSATPFYKKPLILGLSLVFTLLILMVGSGYYFQLDNSTEQVTLTQTLTPKLSPNDTGSSSTKNEREVKLPKQALNQSEPLTYFIDKQTPKEMLNKQPQNTTTQRSLSSLTNQTSEKVKRQLYLAQEALSDNNFISPPGNNAYEYFQQVLNENPNNSAALAGLEKTATALLTLAKRNATLQQFDSANLNIAAAVKISPQHPGIVMTQVKVQKAHEAYKFNLQQKQKTQLTDFDNKADINKNDF